MFNLFIISKLFKNVAFTASFAFFKSLKTKIKEARLKAIISANAQLLAIYWEIGDTIAEQEKQQGWGAKVVEQLARDLKMEFPDFKGLSARNLRYMREFAVAWPESKNLAAACCNN